MVNRPRNRNANYLFTCLGRIFTIFNKHQVFIFHQASQSKSGHAFHRVEDRNKLSCLNSRAASPLSRKEAEEHSGQILLLTEQQTGQEEHFPRHLNQQYFSTLFVATSPESLGSVSQPGDKLVCARAFPPRAVTSRQTGRENWDTMMENLAKQTWFKTPGVFFRNGSEKRLVTNGIRLVKCIKKPLCTHECMCISGSIRIYVPWLSQPGENCPSKTS